MNHTICINASCDQPRAPFGVYCSDCEAVEVANGITTEELPAAGTKWEIRSETVQVKLKPSEKRKLRTIARRQEQSLSDTVRSLILVKIATQPTIGEFCRQLDNLNTNT